ncbi:macro domain-containing protein [Mesorhizobium sp. M1050]|uniref:macro domain-containing protein n=1 Tax=Mesorhizobium sp. M1050 TaxID=2957051 RepID=UPI0033353899
MLIYRRTSLLESSAQTLVNTVNCVGVMGKGIAREFKDREPDMFLAYKEVCEQKKLQPGKLWLWKGAAQWVLNFPTKIHWRNPSKIEWIESGLRKFVAAHEKAGIREISFPRLGCGNGGLDWKDVQPLMERYLSRLAIQVFIHDYTVDIGLPEHLEEVARKLRRQKTDDFSFEGFVTALERATSISNDCLADLETEEPIGAEMREGALTLRTTRGVWKFDNEDLWGVWVALQKGLLTQDKAGWSVSEAGKPLLSVLSLLPNIRPIQIQRLNSEPELAVEVQRGGIGAETVPAPSSQMQLSWH